MFLKAYILDQILMSIVAQFWDCKGITDVISKTDSEKEFKRVSKNYLSNSNTIGLYISLSKGDSFVGTASIVAALKIWVSSFWNYILGYNLVWSNFLYSLWICFYIHWKMFKYMKRIFNKDI